MRKALEGVSDDTVIAYQRIEDVYFEEYGWNRASSTHRLVFNCSGKHLSDDLKMVNGKKHLESDRHMEYCRSDYVEVFSAYKHPDEDVFVLNAHY